ncbi:diguanylate cyclase domain-containing protein [Cohnella faecalis]|uniref:Diguanylate cyclase n=1 Tax=Cohnella faecalis TaxID=2315694 RepID=A0A398CZL2_9BACL|nr:diguanylate cyclase [Cohnella faecalis]RIE04364.1 diguanylate cyclase [Cohnella faecalis]
MQGSNNETSARSPVWSVSRQHLPSWLAEQDLTEADLPYIQPLLTDAFLDWLGESDGFPWLRGRLSIVQPSGKTVIQHGDGWFPESWDAKLIGTTAVSEALDRMEPALINSDKHASSFLRSSDSIAVPIFTRIKGVAFGVVVCLLPAGTAKQEELSLLQAAALHYRSCVYRRFESMFVNGMLSEQKQSRREQRRRDILFEVMRRLNGHIDVENVLSEVLDSLEKLYPFCRADLFLSQDYSSANEKVKPLAFHELDMDLCRHAFLDGQVREERAGGRHLVAMPLTGKQGVYGVLRLDTPENNFDDDDLRFLTMLAGTAGAAFEKAKLHEHANVLIGELRIINELTQQLNRSLRLTDTMQFASAELLHIFNADYCCILQLDASNNEFVIMAANVPELIGETFSSDYGFCGVIWDTKEPIILSDYRSATPVTSMFMEVTSSRSLLASPLLLNGNIIGAVLIGKQHANHFSYENYKLLQVLSTHLGLAMSNASLHAEVRRMVITDNLTGLFARHYLNERIGRKLKKDASGSLILVDIDHFKRINDTYGHQVGDSILIQVSNIIRSSIREGDIAARWGGEELAIYLPQLGLEQTGRVAERIRERVELETDPQVTVSCGISEWHSSDDKISVESLFYRADMALYEAKNNGRNRVEAG